ncbi:glycosyl transferase [Aeriscardovia aeriphila]|uniref:Glycosyl transferase n=1 Tax=Aeriscardovia aeriphila TaxID=218139 RepID=A0A261F8H3_9BIFI|nr:glycosyl transferase [Aeriscardovia aeriphila]
MLRPHYQYYFLLFASIETVNNQQSKEQNLAKANEATPILPAQPEPIDQGKVDAAEVAVLIPCYNEAVTITKVVTDFRRVLPHATIYVYDNNSSDDTAQLAKKAGAVVRHEPRQGKGNVIRSMFEDIDADAYVMVDGDDTYPAEDAPAMIQKILEGYDMVIGDRLSSTYFEENKRPFHNMGNVLVRGSINHMFHSNVTDVMTGYRAMSFGFVKTYPAISRGFELETEMTIHALNHNVKITAMPVQYRDRPEGSVSKLDTVGDGIKVMSTIGRMIRENKPLPFFSWIGGIIALIGAAFVASIFWEFWQTHMVQRFPTLFCAVFMIILGVLFFIAGLILDAQARAARKRFTQQMNHVVYLRHVMAALKKQHHDMASSHRI